jgi:hypothetical protein
MSEEVVQFIIGRAVTDPDYRELLFTNPDDAIAGYELTELETASLKGIQREAFEQNLGELEDRISRAGLGFGDFRAFSSSSRFEGLNLTVPPTAT